jgi:hypothetical protein
MREEETEIPAFAGMTACLGVRLAPDSSTRRSVFQPNRETLKILPADGSRHGEVRVIALRR